MPGATGSMVLPAVDSLMRCANVVGRSGRVPASGRVGAGENGAGDTDPTRAGDGETGGSLDDSPTKR